MSPSKPPALETKVEKLKQCRIRTITIVPAEHVKQSEEQALARLARDVDVKGFRPGKTPPELVREKVGVEALFEEMIRTLLPDVLRDALTVSKANPILRPAASIVSKEPLTVALTFVERPTVLLKKPEKISLEKKQVLQPTEQDIDGFIRNLLSQDRTETPVDRPAAKGDAVRMALAAKDDKGKEVPELTVGRYTLTIGAEELLPELESHLTGVKKGDKKSATISFSDKHEIPAIRGRKLTIEMTVQDVLQITLPDVTAAYLESRFKVKRTPAQFRGEIRDMLFRQRQTQEMRRREEELYKAVRAATSVDLCPELIDAETQSILTDANARLQEQGTTLEDWLKQSGKTPEAMLDETKKTATERITLRLGMEELAKTKNITPSAEEVKKRVADMQGQAAKGGTTTDSEELTHAATFDLTMQKLVESLIA
jgi:trigger factor